MVNSLESLGGNIQCASSREALMYQSATFNSSVENTLGLLADTIRNPLITEDELQQQLETANYEIQEIWSKPDLIIPELMHMAAYKDNTLGHPLLCPKERLPMITRGLIEKYRRQFYLPERIVVAFAGVEHDAAVRMTENFFADMEPTEANSESTTSTTDAHSSSSTLQIPASQPQSPPTKVLLERPYQFFHLCSTSSHCLSTRTLSSATNAHVFTYTAVPLHRWIFSASNTSSASE